MSSDTRIAAWPSAPADTIRRQLVEVIRAVRPQVIVTFDPNGSNLHPDHVAISRFASDAVAAAGDARWFPISARCMRRRACSGPFPSGPGRSCAAPTRLSNPASTSCSTCRAYVAAKEAALKAHRTQHQSLHRIFFSKPDVMRLLGVEMFRQAFGPPLASRPATDVFADLVPNLD